LLKSVWRTFFTGALVAREGESADEGLEAIEDAEEEGEEE
jgi:hypothetical protein